MNIKTPLALAITALTTLALGACAHTGADAAADADMPAASASASASASAMSPAMTPPAASSLAEALALVAAVDQHEIKLAQQARSKNVTGHVLEYATMMDTQHTPHLQKTRAMLDAAGGAPASSTGLQQLMTMDQQTQQRLGALEGEAYARAYMEHMVMSHRMGIAMLDASMGVATDPAMREFMQMTRQTMQMHLDRAQQIQDQLGG
jgi:putative membrane protein